MNKNFKQILIIGMLSLMICASAIAQTTRKVVVVGTQTDLQKKVIGNRTVEIKAIEKPDPDKDPQGKKLLDNVDEVYVNAAGFTPGALVQDKYVQEAMERKLPLIIENIKKDDLLKLAGIGINAKVAVVESIAGIRGARVSVIEEGDPGVPSGTVAPRPPFSDENMMEDKLVEMDVSKLTPEEMQKMKELEPIPKSVNRVKLEKIPKGESVPATIDELVNDVKKTLEQHKAKRKVVPQGSARTGFLIQNDGNYFASSDPAFIELPKKSELRNQIFGNSTGIPVPQTVTVPNCAQYYIDWSIAQRTWAASGQTRRVNISYDIWLYASSVQGQKYLLMTEKGELNPGTLLANTEFDRGYYTERFYQKFGPYNNGLKQKVAPENCNDVSNVATTTGWSVGATAGADANGPSTSVSFSYSSSTTVSHNIPDFKVNNTSDNRFAMIDYTLSKCGEGNYNDWTDLMYQPFLKRGRVATVPQWSTSNMYPYTEGVWSFPKTTNSAEQLYIYQYVKDRRVTETANSIWKSYYNSSSYGVSWTYWPSVDFSLVQIPHLGINASSNQSSTGWNGHQSRAIDGVVNGNYTSLSVTHTLLQQSPYWEVTLESNYVNTVIQAIEIWNRTDAYPERLQNYKLFVSDSPFTSTDLNTTIAQANSGQISMYSVSGENGRVKLINVARTGRYIRVQLVGTNYLSLAEVRVIPKGYY